MTDIKTPEERSINMSHIRRADTHPEVVFRKWLFADGFRYSLENRAIIGHPDLWMPKYNLAVFVHGCFWHRHEGCKYSYIPKTRVDFWSRKFEKNVARDKCVQENLMEKGIRYLVVWECTIRKMEKDSEYRVAAIERAEQIIRSDRNYAVL